MKIRRGAVRAETTAILVRAEFVPLPLSLSPAIELHDFSTTSSDIVFNGSISGSVLAVCRTPGE
jgi:hypothetical protein